MTSVQLAAIRPDFSNGSIADEQMTASRNTLALRLDILRRRKAIMASRTFSCAPKDTLVICSNEAIVEILIAAGYQSVPQPDSSDDFGAMPRAAHYIVSVCGNSQAIAEDLVGCGICQAWQVSLSDLSCHRDLSHAVEQCGIDVVHRIIGQSEPYVVTFDE
jgi:hypothetical protein